MSGQHEISQDVLFDGEPFLQLAPDIPLSVSLDLSEAGDLTFQVRLPAAGKAKPVQLIFNDNGKDVLGQPLSNDGRKKAGWMAVGPMPLAAGSHQLEWRASIEDGSPWPEGVEPIYLAALKVGEAPVNLNVLAAPDSSAQARAAAETPTSYFTSFEDSGIWYFLRYIPWLDSQSFNLFTAPKQSSQYAASGKYSCELYQADPYGCSQLDTNTLPVPAGMDKLVITFAGLALMANAQVGYKLYFDGKMVDSKAQGFIGTGAWQRFIIEEEVPAGTANFMLTLDIKPLPNIPLNNSIFIDDLLLEFSKIVVLPAKPLVFGDVAGNVYALNAATGQKMWQYKTQYGYITSPPAAANGKVYFGDGQTQSNLYALNGITGQELWKIPIPGSIDATPQLDGSKLYTSSSDGYLYAYDPDNQQSLWRVKIFDPPSGDTVKINANYLYGEMIFLACDNGVTGVWADPPRIVWQFPTTESVEHAPSISQRLAIFGCVDGNLYACDAVNGTPKWQFNTSDPIHSPTQIVGGTVVFGNEGGDLYGVRVSDGTQVFRLNVNNQAIRSFLVYGTSLYVGGNGVPGAYYAYDYTVNASNQWTFTPRWSVPLQIGVQNAPVVYGDLLYITASDKKVYALELFPASQQEKRSEEAMANGTIAWQFDLDFLAFAAPGLCPLDPVTDRSGRYDQYCYLTSHNAFTNVDSGWMIAEQTKVIPEQLDDGVRALMVDIWLKTINGQQQIVYDHGDWGRYIMPTSPWKWFTVSLWEIKRWLDNNPTEVLTMFMEQHINTATPIPPAIKQMLMDAFVNAKIAGDIFYADRVNTGSTGSTWNVATQGWPTLQWMIDNGLRFVVFSDWNSTGRNTGKYDGFPWPWDYAVENDFGPEGLKPGCDTRGESQPVSASNRSLFIMNYFGDVVSWWTQWQNYPTLNNSVDILAKAQVCHDLSGLPNRWPNFLAVDRYELGLNGGPQEAVAEINKKWAAIRAA